jgi:hypothetical protein
MAATAFFKILERLYLHHHPILMKSGTKTKKNIPRPISKKNRGPTPFSTMAAATILKTLRGC